MKSFLILILCTIPLLSIWGEEKNKSIIILTTEKIVSQSTRLQNFVSEKEKRGFKTRVVTEKQYGGTEKKGIEKALIIRKWLQENHDGYRYLLLLGNVDPENGDVPMITTWPMHMYGNSRVNKPILTDMLYSDLTGNWDLNGNGKYGETNPDSGEGGIDFKAELVVGRIPVYDDEIADLDMILSKTVDYMNQPENRIEYRKHLLFASGFYVFEGQDGWERSWEETGVAECIIKNNLKNQSEFSYKTMYEQEGALTSGFQSDLPLNRENFLGELSSGCGVVFFSGTAFEKGAIRFMWREDSNGNGKAEEGEVEPEPLLMANETVRLDDKKLTFLVSLGGAVGDVRNYGSFGSELLKNGAVGILGSTSMPYYPAGIKDHSKCTMEKNSYGNDTAVAVAITALTDGKSPAEALALSKSEYGNEGHEGMSAANKMVMNWLGDPSLTLKTSGTAVSDEDADTPEKADDENDSASEKTENDQPENPESSKSSGSGCSLTILD